MPMTSKRASKVISFYIGNVYIHIPAGVGAVVEPSTLTACSRAGSTEELVAVMLMHRAAIGVGRAVAADVRWRWARDFQGEAAGRSMAVPVSWRMRTCANWSWSGSCFGRLELGACTAMMQACSALSERRNGHMAFIAIANRDILVQHHIILEPLFHISYTRSF